MFDEFMAWYTARHTRREGSPPAQTTLKGKRSRLVTAMKESSTNNLEQLTTLLASRPDVERLLDNLYARLSPGSVQLVVRTLLDLGEWGKREGLIDNVCLTMQDCPRGNPQKPISVYSDAEVEALVGAAAGVSMRWWGYLYTVAETGRRASEVLNLEWSWLRVDADPPHFALPHTKNKRMAYVPLSARLVENVYTRPNIAFLATRDDGGRYQGDPSVRPYPWHYQSVYNMFRRLCRVTGVEHRGLHCFRHTRATSMLARGVPLQAVSALLGHASVGTTARIYDHTTSLTHAHYLNAGS